MANKKAIFNTNKGSFKIELFNDKTPLTTGNFIKLIDQGFYNGIIFHRVIPGFMIQGGCPHGTGRGGPGYKNRDEFHPKLKHDGSQFFITVAPTPWLDDHHAIFGQVIEGMDVVEKISKVQTVRNDKPLEDVVIQNIKIE